jgi:FkbM family methyltransferase
MRHDGASDTGRAAVVEDGRQRRLRAAARAVLWSALRRVVHTRSGLAAVNRLHRRLSLRQKRRFFYACFDLACAVEGPWIVDFAGRRLVLPLHRDFELAWIAATGFHGYDTEVHEFYEALVRGPWPPRVFYDVGASYGLHSLKLLAHGVRVVSFEPNPACHAFLATCCGRNHLEMDLRAVAVGAGGGSVTLRVPRGRSWLGTTAAPVAERWGRQVEVETHRVPQVTLDQVAQAGQLVPDLIKIDTEGSELAVLAGARAILEHARPLLLLESWPERAARIELFEALASRRYRLHALRFATPPSAALSLEAFVDSPATNFAARPIDPASASPCLAAGVGGSLGGPASTLRS